MNMNLKTTVKAYPKISNSILENYVTKEDLENKDYVDNEMLQATLSKVLADYVKDAPKSDDSIIYGRMNGEWVPVMSIPQPVSDILFYGVLDKFVIESKDLLSMQRRGLLDKVIEYLVESEPEENGFFWMCCTQELDEAVACNGLKYDKVLMKQPGVLPLEIAGKMYLVHCYHTEKIVALPDVTYRFRAKLKRCVNAQET